jgi:hypothetical protein
MRTECPIPGLISSVTFFGRQGVRGRQKINCFGLWHSKITFLGGGWRPDGRQVNNSTGDCGAYGRQLINAAAMAWRATYC